MLKNSEIELNMGYKIFSSNITVLISQNASKTYYIKIDTGVEGMSMLSIFLNLVMIILTTV